MPNDNDAKLQLSSLCDFFVGNHTQHNYEEWGTSSAKLQSETVIGLLIEPLLTLGRFSDLPAAVRTAQNSIPVNGMRAMKDLLTYNGDANVRYA